MAERPDPLLREDRRTSVRVYGQMIRLTLPIVVQNLLSALVSSADVMMLSSLGQSAISAVSLAAQYTSLVSMVYFGLGTGVSILASQYWGRKDIHAIELVQGIALRFSMLVSVICFVLMMTVPEALMRVYTPDPELIELGVQYLRITGFGFLFWGVSEMYLASLRSVGRVTISTMISTLSLGLNVLLNAVFIFGLLGAPKMGVLGVGMATSIARAAALVACFGVSACSGDVKLRLRLMFVRNRALFRDFLHMSVPALLNDVSWGAAFSLYSAIMGHMGSDVVSANAIVVVIRNFATVLCYAVGGAATIWVGRLLGAGELEAARRDAGRLIRLTVVTGLLGGLLMLGAVPIALRYAEGYVHLTEQAVGFLRVMLLINSYYVMGTAVNTTLIVGIFRAGGDSRFGFICDSVDMWCYGVPLGFLAAFVLKLPPMWVYFLICTDEFVKWPWVFRHYRSMKWLKNITRDYGQGA